MQKPSGLVALGIGVVVAMAILILFGMYMFGTTAQQEDPAPTRSPATVVSKDADQTTSDDTSGCYLSKQRIGVDDISGELGSTWAFIMTPNDKCPQGTPRQVCIYVSNGYNGGPACTPIQDK